MKKSLLFIALIISAMGLSAQTNVSGTLTNSATWTTGGSPYIVIGAVTVHDTITLTIESGVEVKFNTNQSFNVNGILNATGVTFTSNQVSPAKGDWYDLNVASNGTANLTSCNFLYGRNVTATYGTLNLVSTSISNFSDAGISIAKNGTVNLTGSSVSASEYPVQFTGAGSLNLLDENNVFTGNDYDVVYLYFAALNYSWEMPDFGIPYRPYTYFTVHDSVSLTIESNVIVKSTSEIIVNGILKAEADPGEKIYFTSWHDDNLGGDSNGNGNATAPSSSSYNWTGLTFSDQSDDAECVVRRAEFRYAGTYSTTASSIRSGVKMNNASPTIDECEFVSNVFGAVMVGTSDPVFSNNTIGSSLKTPIAMSFEANPVFSNNVFSFSDNEYDAIGLIGGDLSADAVLPIREVTTDDNVTYVLLSDIIIPEDKTLTINKGVAIKGLGGTDILVRGTLLAQGDADSTILFTSVKDDNDALGLNDDTNKDGTQTDPGNYDWGGIIITSTGGNTILDYCTFKYSYAQSSYYYNLVQNYGYASVAITNASPTISNSVFKDNLYGLKIYQTATPVISNNEFANSDFAPISMSVSADPAFSGNTFTNVGLAALGIISETVTLSGTIKNRDIAGYTNISYVLTEGDLTIASGTEVSVEPGVVIKIDNRQIIVEGGFKAVGASDNKIIFTSIKDDNAGNPMDTNGDGNATTPATGNWDRIFYSETADDVYNVIDHTEIRFGGDQKPSSPHTPYGAIYYENAGGTVSNTLITDARWYGLKTDGTSDPTFDNVTIQNCTSHPIAMSLKSDPQFTNMVFTANGSQGLYIIEGILSSDAIVIKRDVAGINNIAYIVDALTVTSNAVLTIAPGVVVKLNSWINVEGKLIAEGTEAEMITFTSYRDDSRGGDTNNDGNESTPNKGNWGRVEFDGASSETLVKFCDFRYGSSIDITDCDISVDSSIIQNFNSWAMGIYGTAEPVISNNSFYNIDYTPVKLSMFSEPTFTGNTMLNVGMLGLMVASETYSQSDTIPYRDFAGINNITYYLEGNLTVGSGTELVIPEGIVFKSNRFLNSNNQDNGYIDVKGKLTINGTMSDPVIFTHYYDDGYGNPADFTDDGASTSPQTLTGRWIHFDDVSNDTSSINYAVFKYRSYGIELNSASPVIANCLFENTDRGISLEGVSEPVIENNIFHNLRYSPIYISLVSFPESYSGNTISGDTYKVIEVRNETLVQDVTLSRYSFGGVDNIPFLFTNYIVGTSAILSVDPGVILKFQSGGRLTVKNGLLAAGKIEQDSLIVFTTLHDDYYGGDSNSDSSETDPVSYPWYGVKIDEEALETNLVLDYCVFRFAGNEAGVTANNSDPTITNSLFNYNKVGVKVTGSADPVINYCDFAGNTDFAVQNVDLSRVIDATNNWWGHNTGPTHSGNSGGTGEEVTDNATYDPWLTDGANNPLLGDVSLNGMVQAFDASLILEEVVSPGTLTARQISVADVSGDGNTMAMDASYVLQYAVGIINAFPANVTYKSDVIPASGTALSIDHASLVAGESVKLALNAHHLDEINALQSVLRFDPEVLEISSFEFDKQLKGTYQAIRIDRENGELRFALAGTVPVTLDGPVAYMTVNIHDVATAGITEISVLQLVANESDLRPLAENAELNILNSVTGIDHSGRLDYKLTKLWPNPMVSELQVSYSLPEGDHKVQIAVYNTLGQEIARLVDETRSAGEHRITWNAEDNSGVRVSEGMYFIRMVAGDFVETQRILVTK